MGIWSAIVLMSINGSDIKFAHYSSKSVAGTRYKRTTKHNTKPSLPVCTRCSLYVVLTVYIVSRTDFGIWLMDDDYG